MKNCAFVQAVKTFVLDFADAARHQYNMLHIRVARCSEPYRYQRGIVMNDHRGPRYRATPPSVEIIERRDSELRSREAKTPA